ncbi:hypothetical protein ACTL6P_20910 [Endozoicomonas acroporae]|uniref:hypothetical protein n=1 Tax=Endozoicomonas acroporae TaxID=1701104 RepID=UPI000C77257A|nr:hypothetical protein [Endozoicomonas acroporae]
MSKCAKRVCWFIGGGLLAVVVWVGWSMISLQLPGFKFQNSTYEPLSVFRVIDNHNYTIAMQRTNAFRPGDHKSIGGPVSRVPSYLIVTFGDEKNQQKSKLDISESLPWKVWLQLTFMPWRYTAEFTVNVLPEEVNLSWILKDKSNKLKALACGGWLIDRYRMDVIDKFKHYRFSDISPREHVLCNPLSYIGFERKRIEAELSKK